KGERVFPKGLPELTKEQASFLDARGQLLLEESERPTSSLLGTVQSQVCPPQEILRLFASIRRQGNSYTDTDGHLRAVDRKWGRQSLDYPPGDSFRAIHRRAALNDRELIAAEPGD